MKVAFVHQPVGPLWTPGTSGSVGIWVYEVARRLARRCDMVVYAKLGKRDGRWQPARERYEGVDYRRVSVGLDEALLAALRPLGRLRGPRRPLFVSTVGYLRYIVTIARDLRSLGCDVIHIHGYPNFVPVVRAFNPRTPIVLHMHGQWLTQFDPRLVERWIRPADLIVGVSDFVTDKIRRRFPHVAGRCHTVYMGVDPDQFTARPALAPGPTGARLLYVGRISPEKGLHVLLDAFALLAGQCPEATLRVVGPEWLMPRNFVVDLSDDPMLVGLKSFYNGSYLAHLKGRLFASGAKNVSFSDLVTHEHISGVYRDADIYVNPSFTEGLPMSVVEAMASGLPVVATRVGGVPEIVEEGKTGLLVDPGDAGGLAQAILRVLGDPKLRDSMARAGRARAIALCSWDLICENLLSLYKTLPSRGL
jgi:spore coat protein SA